MISKKEIAAFWLEYAIVQIGYGMVILFGYLFWPVAYFLRYVVKWKNNFLWFLLNDETDFGDPVWLDKNDLQPGFWSAWKWFFRNPAWNFIKSIETPSHKEVYDVLTVKRTLNSGHRLTNANRDKRIYGVNHVYYRLSDGKVYGRYSRANQKTELMLGVGNGRYVFRWKI